MSKLPEGRKPLTDEDMSILLHDMARTLKQFGAVNLSENKIKQVADRFTELAKKNEEE